MNTTIRNLDDHLYRQLKARAALEGKNVGEVINAAIRVYVSRPGHLRKTGSLRDLEPQRDINGNETLSEDIDKIVYGI